MAINLLTYKLFNLLTQHYGYQKYSDNSPR